MSTATATKTYSPVITEALPLTKEHRTLAAEGFRGFWVEAKSKRMVKGVRIVRYLLTVMPSGHIKCPCEAHKWSNKDCCHITALGLHLNDLVIRQAEQIAAEKADALELLDRETTSDEWTEVPAEEIAEIERRIDVMRRQTQAEIDRENAKRRREAALLDTEPRFSFVDGLPLAV